MSEQQIEREVREALDQPQGWFDPVTGERLTRPPEEEPEPE